MEHSQNSLRSPATREKEGDYVLTDNCQARGGLHSKFIEPLQNLLKAMSMGKSRGTGNGPCRSTASTVDRIRAVSTGDAGIPCVQEASDSTTNKS